MSIRFVRGRLRTRRMRPWLLALGVPALIAATNLAAQTPQRSIARETTTIDGDRRSDEMFSRRVTVNVSNVSLKRALDAIAASARVELQYREADLDAVTAPVSVHAESVPLSRVLGDALRGTNLRVLSSIPNVITIQAASPEALPAEGIITGIVINASTKQPIVGATVLLDGAQKGVTTDNTGAFRFPATVGPHRVTIRFVGFLRQMRTVDVAEGKTATLEIALAPSASVLDEVVVTGTVAATERKAIPNPITVITSKEIEERGITRVDQLLHGEVPGVIALDMGEQSYLGNQLGGLETSKVYSRGASNLTGGATPLKTYIDGVELLDPSYLGTIDPRSIERIEIITGPQAATVYGSGAMGGVMQIFTKKGAGHQALDLLLSLKYGMLESNLSSSLTPTHNHVATVNGGSGPNFSYSGTASYLYTGQWRPDVFSRSIGTSAGMMHTRGRLTFAGSASFTSGLTGTSNAQSTPALTQQTQDGWLVPGAVVVATAPKKSTSSNQTLALNVDHRTSSFWQQHATIGRSQNIFELIPSAPVFSAPSDTSFLQSAMTGQRTTLGYNTVLTPRFTSWLSSTLTLGATGATAKSYTVGGEASTSNPAWLANPSTQLSRERSAGGFGQMQLGFFDRLYLTYGLRGERSPTYGRDHRIDWTPTNGITYTQELGDLSVKVLGSYGRATRLPAIDLNKDVWSGYYPGYMPDRFLQYLGNPTLVPERSYGPQFGAELYYGNLGSLTVNRYDQKVSDLILPAQVDSVPLVNLATGDTSYAAQYQYLNIGDVRQQGWETTASLNLWLLTLRGTYSWTDSRVQRVGGSAYGGYAPGQVFRGLPTHTGSFIATYAHRGTSITLTSNYVGKSIDGMTFLRFGQFYTDGFYARHRMYVDRRRTFDGEAERLGYVKTDLAASHQLTRNVSLSLNVFNLANSFQTDGWYSWAYLGRRSYVGLSWRTGR